MNLKWEKGRQKSGYEKLKIFESKFLKFDCYLLKFKTGAFIDKHTDPVQGHKHYRFNLNLNAGYVGGNPIVYGKCILKNRFFYLFRPDIVLHEVSKVEKGVRYTLSIGWLVKLNKEVKQ